MEGGWAVFVRLTRRGKRAEVWHLDGGDDEQVLQVVVVGEGGVLQHDLLQQLDQLGLEASLHEALHRHRHLLRVLGLRQRRGHHLSWPAIKPSVILIAPCGLFEA